MTQETPAGALPRPQSVFGRHALAWLAVLWAIHTGMNLLWRVTNVVVLGWDQPGHLVRALEYFRLLQPFSLEGVLNALTNHSFYPPLFHISAAAFFAVFGVSADSGAMANAVYLAILLGSVYGIGRSLYDADTGLLAACLVSLFPIVFNMSRFTYVDFAMMALTALSVWLLLRSDRFQQRRWAYLLGVALGLGLLAKWVFVVFAGIPCLYVLLRSPVPADLKAILTTPRPQWKRLAVALLVGLPAGAFWFLPGEAWQARAAFALPLSVLYAFVVTVVVYVAVLPSRPFNNFVGAMGLALGVAGVWYVPNSDFIWTGLYKAYYVGSVAQPSVSSGPSLSFGILLRGIVNEHLSTPIAVLALALLLAWVVRRRGLAALSFNVWLLGLWFITPLAFFASFSNQSSWNMRLTICILLPLSVVLARTCLSIRQTGLRRGLTGLLLAIAIAQWCVLSLDAFAAVPGYTAVQAPVWGALSWFAGGEFVQWPASNETDSAYWIAPEILRRIAEDRDSAAPGLSTVGLLVNQPYLNGYHTAFLTGRDFPDLDVTDLFRDRGRLPVYPQIFQMDYVLVSDSGISSATDRDQSTRLVTSILTRPTAEFSRAFRQIAGFEVPNGDVIHLYRNLTYEPPRWIPPELTSQPAAQVANVNFGDQMLLISYEADPSSVAIDHKLKIDLFWEGLSRMTEDYRITLKLVNPVYEVWGQQQGHPGLEFVPDAAVVQG